MGAGGAASVGGEQQVVTLEERGRRAGGHLQGARRAGVAGRADAAAQQAEAVGGGLEIIRPRAPPQQPRHRFDLGAGLAGQHGDVGRHPGSTVHRRRRLFHLVAQRRQQPGGVVQGRQAVGMHAVAEHRLRTEGDAQPAGLAARFVDEAPRLRRRRVGRPGIGAGRGIEQRGAVAHRAGQRVFDRHAMPELAMVRTGGRHAAAGLEAEQAAAGSGNADRATAVAATGHRHQARRHRGGRAAAGAAWRMRGRPGVARGAAGQGLGVGREAELRRVGAAEHQQPGRPVAPHQFAVVRHRHRGQAAVAVAGGLAGDRGDQVLHQEGHAGEGRLGIHARDLGTGGVEAPAHHGVECRVKLFDARDGGFQQFRRAQFPAAHQGGQRGGIVAHVFVGSQHRHSRWLGNALDCGGFGWREPAQRARRHAPGQAPRPRCPGFDPHAHAGGERARRRLQRPCCRQSAMRADAPWHIAISAARRSSRRSSWASS